jgi:acyl-CoA dehydrogenase
MLPRVPWGRESANVVTIALQSNQTCVVVVDCRAAGVRLEHGQNIASESRDTLVLDDVKPVACVPTQLSSIDLMAIAAVARAAQMAGGLRAILTAAVDYANLRVQFGRSLSQFQAIQQKLASFATQTAAALAAAEAGLEAIDTLLPPGSVPVAGRIADNLDSASAKVRAGEAAGLGAAMAHQVFGAIGFTEEHSLHLHTKRLWAWRDEYGNEAFWSRRIGEAFIAAGPRQVWPRVTAHAGHLPAAGARDGRSG